MCWCAGGGKKKKARSWIFYFPDGWLRGVLLIQGREGGMDRGDCGLGSVAFSLSRWSEHVFG